MDTSIFYTELLLFRAGFVTTYTRKLVVYAMGFFVGGVTKLGGVCR
jgi:hypothetical protein